MNPLLAAVDTDLLFVLALVGFYLLRNLMARRQPAQQRPRPERPGPDSIEPDVDDALGEIRRALGMEPVPEPEPLPEPVVRVPLPRPEFRERTRRGEFHPMETARADAEERFERGGSTFRDPLAGHTRTRKAATPVPAPPPVRQRPRLLATGRQLRDALVLMEILGPPRARKRQIR